MGVGFSGGEKNKGERIYLEWNGLLWTYERLVWWSGCVIWVSASTVDETWKDWGLWNDFI